MGVCVCASTLPATHQHNNNKKKRKNGVVCFLIFFSKTQIYILDFGVDDSRISMIQIKNAATRELHPNTKNPSSHTPFLVAHHHHHHHAFVVVVVSSSGRCIRCRSDLVTGATG
jgi:hypothetical protein